VHAVTEGTDVQAEVSVRLEENGKIVTAKGADPDMPVASAKAYLGALNRLMAKRLRTKPQPMTAGAESENIRRVERGP
jgi:2-isopropylmalate synthase